MLNINEKLKYCFVTLSYSNIIYLVCGPPPPSSDTEFNVTITSVKSASSNNFVI